MCLHIDLTFITFFLLYQAALDHLVKREDIDTSRIVIFGRSLGGAVGTVLAKNNPDKVLFCPIFEFYHLQNDTDGFDIRVPSSIL